MYPRYLQDERDACILIQCIISGNPDYIATDAIHRDIYKTPEYHQQNNCECRNPGKPQPYECSSDYSENKQRDNKDVKAR